MVTWVTRSGWVDGELHHELLVLLESKAIFPWMAFDSTSQRESFAGHVRVVLASLPSEGSKATKPSARSTRLLPGVMLPQ